MNPDQELQCTKPLLHAILKSAAKRGVRLQAARVHERLENLYGSPLNVLQAQNLM